jgi:hypothetical protein
MSGSILASGQSLNCPELHDGKFCCRTSTSTPGASAPATASGCVATRLSHRAIQTLRQTRLQLCGGPRSRPEVLFIGELSGRTAADGLHPTRTAATGKRVRRQPPTRARDPRAGLRNQPRTAASTRGALNGLGERGRSAHRTCRHPRCKPAAGQYDRELVGRTVHVDYDAGGRS